MQVAECATRGLVSSPSHNFKIGPHIKPDKNMEKELENKQSATFLARMIKSTTIFPEEWMIDLPLDIDLANVS